MSRARDALLHLNRLRKAVGFQALFSAIGSKTKLDVLKITPKENILVIAPHIDDDVFGCGGFIKLNTLIENQVAVIFLIKPKDKKRYEEAEKSSKILGIQKTYFGDGREGNFVVDENILNKITEVIEEVKPTIICVPSVLDSNPDHYEAAKALADALKYKTYDGLIFAYEVWQPLFASRLVVIDSVINYKKKAIRAHASQLNDRDYLEAIIGLNRYRAGMFRVGEYAEAFFSYNKELYLKLLRLNTV